MFRLAGILSLSAVIAAPVSLQSQRHGGGGAGRGGGGAARAGGGVVVRPSPAPGGFVGARPGVQQPRPVVPPSSFRAAPVVRSPIARSPRTVIVNPGFGFGSFGYSPFGYYPYGYYPGYYNPFSPQYFYSAPYGTATDPYAGAPGYSYSEPAYAAPVPEEPPAVSQNEADLSYEVGRLSAEVEQLRQQQAQSQAPPPPQSQGPLTALIFRDGRQVEIQNYAIVGQTLWILDQRNSSKIPLADLDLEATQKENRSRGLRFITPSSR